jgi:hypothetical protein
MVTAPSGIADAGAHLYHLSTGTVDQRLSEESQEPGGATPVGVQGWAHRALSTHYRSHLPVHGNHVDQLPCHQEEKVRLSPPVSDYVNLVLTLRRGDQGLGRRSRLRSRVVEGTIDASGASSGHVPPAAPTPCWRTARGP